MYRHQRGDSLLIKVLVSPTSLSTEIQYSTKFFIRVLRLINATNSKSLQFQRFNNHSQKVPQVQVLRNIPK